MAVIMAAMSGIIGGEVVLLGLIALPQMLRLGYNQNLAIGTICASGSLGTMIPPSIVLIIYGLITETSIKALFTGAFVPGFMLACFIILYIVIRTQLNPDDAPLPEQKPGDPTGIQKLGMFSAFLSVMLAGVSALCCCVRFSSRSLARTSIWARTSSRSFWACSITSLIWPVNLAAGIVLSLFIFGRERSRSGWEHGKGLVPPFTVIGVVLGSITGESPASPRRRAWVHWPSLSSRYCGARLRLGWFGTASCGRSARPVRLSG